MSLANRANRIAPVSDLPTIDEKAEETGVDNFKIGLKEKVKILEPTSILPIPKSNSLIIAAWYYPWQFFMELNSPHII